MRLRELTGVPPYHRRELVALRELVNDIAEYFSTNDSRGFRELVSSSIWRPTEQEKHTWSISRRACPIHGTCLYFSSLN